jgi:hypothetical protein
MSAEIIQFSQFAAAAEEAKEAAAAADPYSPGALAHYRAGRVARQLQRQAELESSPDSLTETCRNKRMREGRQEPWHRARVTAQYWRARMDWCDALTVAQSAGIKEGAGDKGDHPGDRDLSLRMWRNAIAAQMLTPAPDMGAITWKRGQLRGRQWRWTSTTDKQVERAIADDVAWLEQHPTKKFLLAAAQARARKSRKLEDCDKAPAPITPEA